jgi:hypothetical protein
MNDAQKNRATQTNTSTEPWIKELRQNSRVLLSHQNQVDNQPAAKGHSRASNRSTSTRPGFQHQPGLPLIYILTPWHAKHHLERPGTRRSA